MGEFLAGLRGHRRLVALGAVVLLPMSTAAATASAAGPSSPAPPTFRAIDAAGTAPVAAPSPTAVTGHPSLATPKTLPAGWAEIGGHTVVVVGTVRERVAQVSATTSYDVPLAAMQAYRNAAASVARTDSGCHLSWSLLAGIGQVESNHGRYAGASVLANGDTSPHILGPVLNGVGGVGAIRDTDGGRYDGDAVWDRAVGPMQFIPGTWAGYGADGNGDGVSDPNNIKDAALAAAHYLCAGGGDLRVKADLRAAVMRYNHSVAYVNLVLRLARAYAHGSALIQPNGTGHGTETGTQTTKVSEPPSRDQHARRVPGSGRQHGSLGHGGLGGQGGSGQGGQGGGGQGGGGRGGGGHGGGGGHQPPPITTHPITTHPITTHPIQHPPTTTTPVPSRPTPTGPGRPKPPEQQPTKPPKHQHPEPSGPRRHPQPDPPLATGPLERCDTGWCVDGLPLDFGTADLGQRLVDLDGNGKTTTLSRELRAVSRLGTTVTVIPDPAAEPPVEPTGGQPLPSTPPATDEPTGQAEAPAATSDPSASAPATAPGAPADPSDSSSMVVTVDATGLVTSINTVPVPQV